MCGSLTPPARGGRNKCLSPLDLVPVPERNEWSVCPHKGTRRQRRVKSPPTSSLAARMRPQSPPLSALPWFTHSFEQASYGDRHQVRLLRPEKLVPIMPTTKGRPRFVAAAAELWHQHAGLEKAVRGADVQGKYAVFPHPPVWYLNGLVRLYSTFSQPCWQQIGR